MGELRNWAGNFTYNAARLHQPETVAQAQEIAARSRRVKALGTRHSFNNIADTTEDQVSLAHLNRVVELDRAGRTVTVEGGVRYGELGQYLHREGFALHNLASLPHISVAGACATATHGSGDRQANLATAVAAIEVVTANGQVVTFSREQDSERFHGAVVGLGGIGIVTKVTLNIEPAFTMRQDLYENLPLSELENHFEEVFSSAYSVSLFTDWQQARFNQVWRKSRVTDDATLRLEPVWHCATLATRPLHPIGSLSAVNCTEQMGVPGPWHERLPHFRLNYTPSSGEELQTEYLVPRQYALAALNAVYELRERVAPLLQISEVRTIAADSLWMSPCYQQNCIALHFTWKPDWPAVKELLPEIEARLAPLNARPHWGKLFTMRPELLKSLYPKLPDYQRLQRSLDPEGKFRNAFLDTYLLED